MVETTIMADLNKGRTDNGGITAVMTDLTNDRIDKWRDNCSHG